MKRFLASLLIKLSKKLNKEGDYPQTIEEKNEINKEQVKASESAQFTKPRESKVKKQKLPKSPELTQQERAARDITEMMEVPFLALSKNRREPIIYEKHDGPNMMRVKVTRHTGHFLASIYDWDIVLYVAGKMQEILNNGTDIPPRTMVIPRHKLLKALRRHDGKKQQKDLEASLSRLQLTGIDTTIRNEDGRYRAGFGFIEDWSYTERREIKEIEITLSRWLYDGICAKGSLLMVDPEYFSITSALKRFLYRTARKHVGGHGKTFEFSLEVLHEKSGSESELKFFKRDLKAAILKNDIPGYHLEWFERNKKSSISFKNITKSGLIETDHFDAQIENLKNKS